MVIEIPDELAEDFLRFLDVAQASLTEEQVQKLPEGEREVLNLVQLLLGGKASLRFETVKKRNEAVRALSAALGLRR